MAEPASILPFAQIQKVNGSLQFDQTKMRGLIFSIVTNSSSDLSPGQLIERLGPVNIEEEEYARSVITAMLAESILQITAKRKLRANRETREYSDHNPIEQAKAAAATKL